MADPQTPLIVTAGLPVATLVLGFVTGAVSDAFKDQRRLRGEREAREDAREKSREERVDQRLAEREKGRYAFELEHLTAAYDALADLGGATIAHHMSRQLKAIISEGNWPPPDPRSGEGRAAIDATREAGRACRLILDDDLRQFANQALAAWADLDRAGGQVDQQELDRLSKHATRVGNEALSRVADRIREIVKGSPTA